MSILIPESNAMSAGNTSNGVALGIPAGASFKPSNRGFIVGIWVEVPAAGYENNVNYNILTRGGGVTSGNDGYIRFNQAASQLSTNFRSGGTQLLTATTLTKASQNWKGKKILLGLIQTAANAHLFVCEPGSAPEYVTAASTGIYTTSLAASDCWSRIGPGNSTSLGHYGPVEEAFFILGEFPETSNVPDTTLIAAIAAGTQSLDTLHSSMTNGTKKWRYRMLQQDTLTDAFGIAGNLNPINTDANKVLLSGGPLRPNGITPTYGRRMVSQVTFGTPGVAATATANINIPGGTYSGLSPAKVEARLRKEDGSVLVAYQTVDAAPAAGVWQPSVFANVPGTAGWLTIDYRFLDGSNAQIGDIVSSYQIVGAGFDMFKQSQSQGYYFEGQGSGLAAPTDIRFCATFLGAAGALPFLHKTIMPGNTAARLARGAVQYAIELHTLFPKWPISFNSISITGTSLSEFISTGPYADRWAAFKTFIGVMQPYYMFFYGHSQLSGTSVATYQSWLDSACAKAASDMATPIKYVHGGTARYADAAPATNYVQVRTAREAIRGRVAANPTTDYLAGSFNHLKCDSNDTGPHPIDGNTGQGRGGAQIAWGVMACCRAVEDQPLTITAATLLSGGTVLELTLDKVNA